MYTSLCVRMVTKGGFRSPSSLCSLWSFNNTLSSIILRTNENCVLLACQRHASSTNNQDLGREIYHGPLSKRIRAVKLFSLASSMCGLIIQPVFIEKILEPGTSIAFVIIPGIILQFFTFVTPFLLHYVTKKYIRIIYYNEVNDTYTALTYNFWAGDKLLSFKTEDVVDPDIPGMFTSIIVKGTPLFLDAIYFDDLGHYKRIMGFDKPIDFKLHEKPQKIK